jgi:hypothetical protein
MHIWPSKRVMKHSNTFQKMDKEYKYDMLGLSDKEREAIALSKLNRDKRKADKKAQSE